MDTPVSQPSSSLPPLDPASVRAQTSFADQDQSNQQLQPPRKGRRIFLICLLVAVLVALGIGAWLWVRTLQVEKAYEWLYQDDEEVFEESSVTPAPVIEVLDVTLTPGNTVTEIETDLENSDLSDLDTELKDLELEASAAADEE